jgi:hypothetical protein
MTDSLQPTDTDEAGSRRLRRIYKFDKVRARAARRTSSPTTCSGTWSVIATTEEVHSEAEKKIKDAEDQDLVRTLRTLPNLHDETSS